MAFVPINVLFSNSDHPNVTSLVPRGGLVRNVSRFAVFVCTVTGLPLPPVNWRRQDTSNINTSQLIQEQKNKILLRTSSVSDRTGLFTVTSILAILNLTITDSKLYICTGENAFNVTNYLGANNTASSTLSVQCKYQSYLMWQI